MKKLISLTLAGLMAASAALTATAQDYDPARLEAMQELHFLEGRWKGTTWARTRDGERREGQVVEIVQSNLNGAILTLEGLGAEGDPEAPGAELRHHAFAVIYFDPERGYRMHSYKNGGFLDAGLEVTGDNAIRWGFEAGNGRQMRFEIRLDDRGRWTETGYTSADGENWHPFFGMSLARVSE